MCGVGPASISPALKHVGGVVVHAQHVDGGADRGQIPVDHEVVGPVLCQVVTHVDRVLAVDDRLDEEPVGRAVDPADDIEVSRRALGRKGRGEVQRDAEFGLGIRLTQSLSGPAVRQQQVVRGPDRVGDVGLARCMHARGVAQERRAPRLVQRRPGAHPVAQPVVHRHRVIDEAFRGVAVRPTPRQRGGQIPVVEGEPRLDALGQQLVDQPRVEVHARAEHPVAVEHPGPGRREPVGVEPQPGHQRHVVGVAVVVVAGDVAVLAVHHRPGHPAEDVPDRVLLAALVRGALDLKRGRGRAEPEARRKPKGHQASFSPAAARGPVRRVPTSASSGCPAGRARRPAAAWCSRAAG